MLLSKRSANNGKDLSPPWLNFTRRMQAACARHNPGVIVLDVKVVVDQSGNPVGWTSPKVTAIEPGSKSDQILDLLTG